MAPVFVYALIYIVGYFGAYFLNLLLRRVLIPNQRVAGLVLVLFAAIAHITLIASMAPKDAPSFLVGQVAGELAIGPAVMVAICVALEMWWRSRRR